ncbi:MAG: hypothetical protein HOK21_05160 [Rhodospirillaceae bacterium]|nr:hypothetical protein [Rhodospirillaceae bacterium]MBT5523454.1 hypothetical protein [Rhodospirillaceae bacterium]MBT5878561.1 hypothetical protein [Rhodospirillaceae bacterium]MBT6591718.1 hypothetical protein [Rhodospirillaceae bacterium]MBT7284669.1 hypothetical protein [Rhodospirillaceae bacterium]
MRVNGISGLRVADASVMPCIIAGNTNAPSIMIGEKCVAMMLEDAWVSRGSSERFERSSRTRGSAWLHTRHCVRGVRAADEKCKAGPVWEA